MTRDERASLLMLALAPGRVLPSATVSAEDRAHLTYLYRGIPVAFGELEKTLESVLQFLEEIKERKHFNRRAFDVLPFGAPSYARRFAKEKRQRILI